MTVQSFGMLMRVTINNSDRIFERNPRKGSAQPEWLRHRFPIKGGASMTDIIGDKVLSTNALMRNALSRKFFS